MRHLRPALSILPFFQRLRDPQVQVWVMAGCAVLLVLIGHLHASIASGEGKNDAHASASRLLLAGARLEWSEDFAVAPPPTNRPVLHLAFKPLPTPRASVSPALPLDVRAAMTVAAGQPWHALDRPLRSQLATAGIPTAPLKATLRWSGDARGNAALVARHLAALTAQASSTRLVIGNGSRSGDGEIEWLSREASPLSDALEITLIGPGGQTTPRQSAALAELLVHLEALSGHRIEIAAAPYHPPLPQG